MASIRVPLGAEGELLLSDEPLAGKYRILHKDGMQPVTDGEVIDVVGRGGFSVVVRARDQLGLPRAIKIIVPTGHDGTDSQTDLFVEEVRHSNAKPFKNVIPVMDYGKSTTTSGTPFSYFVSPYIEGPSLGAFCRQVKQARRAILDNAALSGMLRDQIILIFRDILGGLVELRDVQVVHMDLSPQNVLLRPPSAGSGLASLLDGEPRHEGSSPHSPNYDAFVIDLGAAKSVEVTTPQRTHLRTKRFWFPAYLLDFLRHGPDATIDRSRLCEVWERIDVYSCGRMVQCALLDLTRMRIDNYTYQEPAVESEREKERFWLRILGDDLDVIEGIAERMVSSSMASAFTAMDAKHAFDTIPLQSSRDILASEILTDRHKGLHIRTAPRLIRVNTPFEEIVEHPLFQRLRRKSQLGLLDEVFPDATHTRFSHSLQAFSLCKRYILSLLRYGTFRVLFQREDVNRMLAAALVHDLGQYSFAHSIEDLRKRGDLAGINELSAIRHDQECLQDVLSMNIRQHPSIGSILAAAGITVADICYLTSKTTKDASRRPADNIGRDMISGMLDVDRISYLTHDSERAGVSFGGAIDVDSLVEAFCVRYEPDHGIDHIALGLEERGVPAAEAVFMGVYWMYRNVYWRKTNRAFMACLKYVFERLLRAHELSAREYWEQTLWLSDWEAMNWLRATFERVRGRDEINPLDNIAELRRIGYRRVLSLQLARRDDVDLFHGIVRAYLASGDPGGGLTQAIGEGLSARASPKRGEILLDVPLKRRLRGAGEELQSLDDETKAERGAAGGPLWVCCRDHFTKQPVSWVPLSVYSPVIGALGQLEDRTARKVRVFMHNDLLVRDGTCGDGEFNMRLRDVIRHAVAQV